MKESERMEHLRKPLLTLPEPLRANEIPSFTHTSVVVRLPEIARRTISENRFTQSTIQRIRDLIDEIPNGSVRMLDIPLASCANEWEEYIQPYLGQNWLDIPWFFAEEYFYIRLLEATGYFHEGDGYLVDPYASQKKLGLDSTRNLVQQLAKQVDTVLSLLSSNHPDSLERLILADLWGNQNDLSMWPVSKNGKGHSGGSAAFAGSDTPNAELHSPYENILSNDSALFLNYFNKLDPQTARVDIILDNAGYELIADLAITDFILTSGLASKVVLHAKIYPVFVSDALIEDIFSTVDWMCFMPDSATREMAIRLRRALANGSLRLYKHSFWTSPHPAWHIPTDLIQELAASDLLISKGDANYRRLLGDLHWPLETPFAQVVSYLQPAVLAIRTCKSEIAVGISPERVPSNPPDWIYNGRFGLIQFAPPNR